MRSAFPLLCLIVTLTILMSLRTTAQGDITPPVLASLQLVPSQVDTSTGDQSIIVTARFTDDLSGFHDAFIIFKPSIGTTQSRSVQFHKDDLVSGTLNDGVYTDTLELPQFSAEGKWVLTEIAIVDQVGNLIQNSERDEDGLSGYEAYHFFNNPVMTPSALYLPLIQEASGTPVPPTTTATAEPSPTATSPANLMAPVLESVDLSAYELVNGGTITVTVSARSNAPVNWLIRTLDGPKGNIYGGGVGYAAEQIESDLWRYQWVEPISPWAPSGVYTYTHISVRNEGDLASEPWPPTSFTVTNSTIATPPVIESVDLSAYELVDGGTITVTVIARSNAPVNWLNRTLEGPKGNIYGGGVGYAAEQIESDLWRYQWTEIVSPWAPSGVYTYSHISVRNEGDLASEPWPPTSFTVTNSTIATPPVIESVDLSAYELVDGGTITVTVIARSSAPVNWLSRTLDGPKGNIYGGGVGYAAEQIESDLWRYQWVEPISPWAPSGVYTYTHIAVRNEGDLASEPWPPVNFKVHNHQWMMDKSKWVGFTLSIIYNSPFLVICNC